jgi:DNA-directed RNA polymerase beta subunit
MDLFLQLPKNNDKSISDADTHDIIRKHIQIKKLAYDQLNSFNDLMKKVLNDIFIDSYGGLNRTVKSPTSKITMDSNASRKDLDKFNKNILTVTVKIRFSDIEAHPPQMVKRETGISIPMTPSFARSHKRNYMSPITCTIIIDLVATFADGTTLTRSYTKENVLLMRFPTMEQSDTCPLSNMTDDVKLALDEDPLDPGGKVNIMNYWVVRHQEGVRPNQLRTFNNYHEGEITRSEMLSKPNNSNSNSAQLIIRIMDTNELTINIYHKPLIEYNFPFYVIFRLLGAKNDKEIIDSILMGDNDSAPSIYIQSALNDNFFTKYGTFAGINSSMSVDEIINSIILEKSDDFIKSTSSVYNKNKNMWYAEFMKTLDLWLFPHLGKDFNSRVDKYKLLGWCIKRMYYVNMGLYPQTDRDDNNNKIIESSGQRLAKMIKTVFNSTIAMVLLNGFEHAIGLIPFEAISINEILENTLDPTKMEKTIIKSIAGGGQKEIKTGRGRTIVSRLNTISQSGSYLNNIHNLRAVVAQTLGATSKNSVREREMRMPHPSSFGYICPIKTQESENVGKTKEMSITTFLSHNSSIQVFMNVFEEEYKSGFVIKNPTNLQIIEKSLTLITINWAGIFIGYTADPGKLADKFRYLRRAGKIDKQIGIHWDIRNDMLIFNCMCGIPLRPMVVVYNNYGDAYTRDIMNPKPKGDFTDFIQWSAVRQSHVEELRTGLCTIDDLVNNGFMEYVSITEHGNSYVAKSFEFFNDNDKDPYNRFDYIEMPASVYSLSVLIGINQNINAGTRNTFAAIHANHAAGHHAFNWRDRDNKGLALQLHNEISPVHSLGNFLTITTGIVATVYIILDEYNVEDGQSHSSAVSDAGRCTVESFEVLKTTLGNDEEFRLPPVSNSSRRRNVNYASINASTGYPDKNTLINKDDVVLAKVVKKIDSESGETTYIDRSVIYTNLEPGIVMSEGREYRNADDILTREVIIVKMRKPQLGDKYSSRSGQKGVIGVQYTPNDMYFTADGRIASMLFNPHSIPSRMTVSQMTEGCLSTMYAMNCISHDGTIHTPININDIPGKLKAAGLHPDGTVLLHNPKTGVVLKTRIYSGMVFYLNQQKFVLDKRYVVAKGAIDVITRQPLEGKSVNGGIRFGEMERDVALVIGATKFMSEKYYYHSNNATIYVCEKCGTIPTVNVTRGVSCRMCLDKAQVYAVDTSWASWVFLNEINAMYKIRIELEDHTFIK